MKTVKSKYKKGKYKMTEILDKYKEICQVLFIEGIDDERSRENGKKFSQSPSDLNKLKLKINEILNNHGINIIRDSVNHMRITSVTNEIPEEE